MPRYVLLRHECDHLRGGSHWDLMLESDGVLATVLTTWAIDLLPQAWAESLGVEASGPNTVAATKLADHRIAYFEYEGPVSGDRGTVKRVATGEFERLTWEKDQAGCIFREGDLKGVARLIRESESTWKLTATTGESR